MVICGLSVAELARRAGVVPATLRTWAIGKEVPATVQAIGRIQVELGVPAGTLSRYCTIRKINMRSDRLKIRIRPEDLTRVRQYLPDDFQDLDADKQQEIYDWVMTSIILSPTDDEGEEVGTREPYRCKLQKYWLHLDSEGAFTAPERLRRQVNGLV